MPQQKQQSLVTKQGSWAQFIVKWVIAAVGAILIAVGAVGLIKTIYKSTLPKYPVESFKIDRIVGPVAVGDSKLAEGTQTKSPELTDEQKREQQDRENEQRVLQEINDYALAAGQLLAGLGLWYVFRLIVKKGD